MFKAGWSIHSTLRNNVHVVSSLLVHAVMCVFLVVHTPQTRPSGAGLNCPDSCSGCSGVATGEVYRHAEREKKSSGTVGENSSTQISLTSGLMPPGISSYNPARMSLARSHSNSSTDVLPGLDVSNHTEPTGDLENGPRVRRGKVTYAARRNVRDRGTGVSGRVINAVASHFANCWTLPSVMSHAEDSVVKINIALDPDGKVKKATVADEFLYGRSPFFRAVADSALRAVHRCSPVTVLGSAEYSTWNEMVLTFVSD